MMKPDLARVLEKFRELAQFDEVELDGPNVRGWEGETPLHFVAEWLDVEDARVLLDAGAEVNANGEDDFTPLHYVLSKAARGIVGPKHIEMVRLLIARGADVNRRCIFGSALDLARQTESAELLNVVQAGLRT